MKLHAYILLFISSIYIADLLSLSMIDCGEEIECCRKMDDPPQAECRNDPRDMKCTKAENAKETGDCTNLPRCPATCFNCPLNYISTLEESFLIIMPSKYISREYRAYTDHFTSQYSSDTWKPPNVF
ncbi:MAG TPA: hypothetical protein VK498_08115 [Ferruginibacter sp.]|nr:hypothetical protein [Ferruginibacter sp.]